MALRTEDRPIEWHGVDVGDPTVRNPAYDAFRLLRIGFAAAPILFGVDKFLELDGRLGALPVAGRGQVV